MELIRRALVRRLRDEKRGLVDGIAGRVRSRRTDQGQEGPGGQRRMGPCNAPSLEGPRPHTRQSLQAFGEAEALRHRWIESEKAGYDLGEEPIRAWVNLHWRGFLRERWMEHLQGRAYWLELDHADYGLLPAMLDQTPLLDEIMRRVKYGEENLDILLWAIDTVLPIDDVINILETLDINGRRIECQFANRLCRSN